MLSPVEQIKGKLSIKDVVESYVKLEKAGVNYKGKCPFHNEKTPSFFVSPGRETFHCFGCGKGGDIFTFVEEIEGVEFKEALKTLAERAGVHLEARFPIGGSQSSEVSKLRDIMSMSVDFYQESLTRSEQAKNYLKERGLTDESIHTFKLGFAPVGWRNLSIYLKAKGYSEVDAEKVGLIIKAKSRQEAGSPDPQGGSRGYYDRFRGRLMFPFFDFSGRAIGYSARVLESVTDDNQGKYINSTETPLFRKSKVFYGFDQAKNAIREKDKVLLVEGQLDVIMAHQVGTNNALGVSGTALTGEHIEQLSRLTNNLVLVLDADEAGFRASERSVRLALQADMYVSVVELPEGADPASCIKENVEIWQVALGRERSYIDYALDIIKKRAVTEKDTYRHVQDYLYGHIVDMYNEIEKDKILQKISGLLGASLEATRADLAKWQNTQKDKGSQTDEADEKKDEEIVTIKYSVSSIMVARRLNAISVLLESRGQVENKKRLDERLATLVNINLPNTDELLFEAEVFYPEGVNLDQETEQLFARLTKEILKQDFTHAMQELRKAENKGDLDNARQWLSKCQELSKKMI